MARPLTSQVVDALSGIDSLREREATLSGQAAPGAGAQLDATRPLGNAAFTHASVAWSIAVDHVEAWNRLLTVGRLQTLAAHATLARAAMEGAIVCRWLMDPTIDSDERRWRGALAELEDHRQRRAFEASAGIQSSAYKPPGKSAAERYREHEALMRRLGIWRRQHDQKMPSTTDLFRDYAIADEAGGGEWVYRLLSAFAHGMQWSALLGEIGERRDIANLPGVYLAHLTSNDKVTLIAALLTMDVLRAALDELAIYTGPRK